MTRIESEDTVPREIQVEPVTVHIERAPGVAGGKPRIVGHRITVQDVVIWHERLGLSAVEIASEYDLALAGVYAALAYYFDHRAEIDQAIRADEAFVADLRKRTPSKLRAMNSRGVPLSVGAASRVAVDCLPLAMLATCGYEMDEQRLIDVDSAAPRLQTRAPRRHTDRS